MSIQIRKFDSTDPDFKAQLADVLAFEASEDEAIDRSVPVSYTHLRAHET